MHRLHVKLIFLALISCLWGIGANAAEVQFAREILPILSNKCFVCHGPDAAAAGDDMLRLDSFEAASADRDNGPAINLASPNRSLLLKRIHSLDNPMPPADSEKQLTDQERKLLDQWIHQGGRFAKHWAYVAPRKTQPAASGVESIPQSPKSAVIDAFIQQQLQPHGVALAPLADRVTLARRISLTLTGLPPDPDSLKSLLANKDAAVLSNFIDGMLASPRFGEHQARYWLDAVRYGDTHGLHLDNKRGIYPYRDWVVRAFNSNMPIDQFIVEQLAGDLLPEPTLSNQVATGFVRLNPSTSEGGAIAAEFQVKNNFDRTETLGTVLLGMSLTCARCHTHKYDPILHSDYYKLFAFFNSTSESPLDGNKYEYGPVAKVPPNQATWRRWEALKLERQALLAADDRTAGEVAFNQQESAAWNQANANERLNILARQDGPFRQFAQLQQTAAQLLADFAALEAEFTTTLVAADLAQPRTTQVLHRGEYDQPVGDPLQPDVPLVLGGLPADLPRNRLGLARWLTSPDQPLVSRVLVNRIWQQVFGYGLVRTPEDFGLQGQQPTHPELLDWLAVEFQESGWDLQHVLRIMLHSRTYRQSSAWRTDVEDPENRLFARTTSYRLDAEVLRDIGLWASGLLDPHMGGEGVKPYQPDGMWQALAHPASNTKQYQRDSGKRLYRRSLYVYWKRTSPHPMMTLFDAPDRESSCVRRSRSNTSLQSLGLLNETQRIEMSRSLAERLIKSRETDQGRLEFLYTLLTCRLPRQSEVAACRQLLAASQTRYSVAPADALALLSVGDIPRDENLDAGTVAAWSQLVTAVLASDAAISMY